MWLTDLVDDSGTPVHGQDVGHQAGRQQGAVSPRYWHTLYSHHEERS